MSLKEDMHTALMAVAPTAPANNSQLYKGDALEYITYFRYNRQGEVYAENEEIVAGSYFQIDLWIKSGSKKDADKLESQIESVLKPLGFMGFVLQDLYEADTKINHIAIRCNYVEWKG